MQKTAAKVERHSAEAVALQTMPALGQKRACVPLRMVAEKHDRPAHLPEHSTRASDAFSLCLARKFNTSESCFP